MIKGAVIFGAGFIFGVAYTSSRIEEVQGLAVAFKQFLQDQALKEDVERKKDADAEAMGDKPIPAEPEEAEVVDPGDKPIQGESAS